MEEKKTLDIHKDYLMWDLFHIARHNVYTLCTYMQDTTPYGDEYQSAFKKITEIGDLFDELEHHLQKCVERKTQNDR